LPSSPWMQKAEPPLYVQAVLEELMLSCTSLLLSRECSRSLCLNHSGLPNALQTAWQNQCTCLDWELPMDMLGAVALSCCKLSQKCWEYGENSIPMNLHLLQKVLGVSLPCNWRGHFFVQTCNFI